MPLILRVEEVPGDDARGEWLVEVDAQLRIGRAAENDLVLADPERTLSKIHCVIRRDGDGYVLIDSSTNGVFLNGAPERMQPGDLARLSPGDSIALGSYRLRVMSVILPGRDGQDHGHPGASFLGPVSNAPPGRPVDLPPHVPDQDPLDLLLGGHEPRADRGLEAFLDDMGEGSDQAGHAPWTPPARSAHPDHAPDLEDGFLAGTAGREAIPADWDPVALFHGGSASVPPAAAPSVAASKTPAGDAGNAPVDHFPGTEPRHATPVAAGGDRETMRAGLDQVLAACGLDPSRLSDAEALRAAERAANLLAVATDGLLRILSGRGAVKQTFNIARTAISQGNNNPMKFTTSAPEALRLMLDGTVPGFLSAEEAMRETVGDIQSHQLSLLAAAQEAMEVTLSRLDPAAIEVGVARHRLPMVRKARAWDAFRATFARLKQMQADADGVLFGEALGRAHARVRQQTGALKDDRDDA